MGFKKYFPISCILLIALLLAVVVTEYLQRNTSAVDLKNGKDFKIAVLDGQKLRENAKCFKAHEKVAEMMSEVLIKIRDSEIKAKADYERVKSDKSLSKEKKTAEISKIETKWVKTSAQYNAEIQDIRNIDLRLSEFIQEKMESVLKSMTKKAGIGVVFNRGTNESLVVFHSSAEIDITDAVIEELDKCLPEIDLKELKHD